VVLTVKLVVTVAQLALNVMKIITTLIIKELIAQLVKLDVQHVLMMKGVQSAMKSQPPGKELVYF